MDLAVMESSDHGLLVIVSHQETIDGGKQKADVATILVPVDFLPDAKKIKGNLFPDGGGIVIEKQRMATPYYNEYLEVLRKIGACKETETTYTTEAARLQSSADCSRHQLSIAFSNG
jgi:hypothetical protein